MRRLLLALVVFGGFGSITLSGAAHAQSGALPPAPPPPVVPPAPEEKKLFFGLTTLNILREKGILTPAEYESALRDLGDTVGAKAGESLSLVLSKWSATMYGFAETDLIWDSTQSLNEVPGDSAIARDDKFAGQHSRLMVSIRNSRFGIRLRAPEWHHIRVSGIVEADFLGTQATTTSEAATFTSPLFRARHYNLKIETPVVDFLIGQWWSLFGWQPNYFPNSVEIMGLPSMLFLRTPQFRVSKTIKTSPINIEIAVALVRPPQRDSGTPEGQGGLRLIINKWTGVQTINSTGTQISPASFAVSATVRHFNINEPNPPPATIAKGVDKIGWGVAASGFVPVIPGSAKKRGNSLSLTGEYVWSVGAGDEYVGMTGGVTNLGMLPTGYAPNIDPGLAVFNADGSLHMVQWQTFMVGAQYTIPGLDGRMWISGNFSRSTSDNAAKHGAPAATRSAENFYDINLFGDITPSVRLGAEYAWFSDHYADGKEAVNHRFQFSAFYLF